MESSISTCSKSFSTSTNRLWCQSTNCIPLKFWKREDTIGNRFSIKFANRALLESNMLWMGKPTGAGSWALKAAPPSEKEPEKTWRKLAAQSIWKRRKGKSRFEMVHSFFFKRKKNQRNLCTRNCRHLLFVYTPKQLGHWLQGGSGAEVVFF